MNLLFNIISIIFILECLLKIIVMGFYFGERTYLKDEWNVLDFIIVLFSIITWILDNISDINVGFMKAFRALRALKPLRALGRNEGKKIFHFNFVVVKGIKVLVNSLLKAIPSLIYVVIILLLFLFVFGILGVQLFSGSIGMCNDNDPSILKKIDCVGQY